MSEGEVGRGGGGVRGGEDGPFLSSTPTLTCWVQHFTAVFPGHLKEEEHRNVKAGNGDCPGSLKGLHAAVVARDLLQTQPSDLGGTECEGLGD